MKHLTVLALILTLWGCGPEQTAQEKDAEQRNQNIEAEKAKLSPLVGQYLGTFTYKNSQRRFTALLTINMGNIFSPDIGRNQQSEVPTLQGSLQHCTEENPDCFKDGDKRNIKTISEFSSSIFLVSSQKLSLRPTDLNQARIEAVLLSPGHITGYVYDKSDPYIGSFDATKISP